LPGIDPAALVRVDRNRAVSGLVEGINQPVQIFNQAKSVSSDEKDMDVDHAPVKMVVMDGIVMDLQVCFFNSLK